MEKTSIETKYKAIQKLNPILELPVLEKSTYEEQFKNLVNAIQDLIDHDFNRLLNLLYRIDVSESKISAALEKTRGKNAAETLAELIIEREVEKRRFREMYKQKNRDEK